MDVLMLAILVVTHVVMNLFIKVQRAFRARSATTKSGKIAHFVALIVSAAVFSGIVGALVAWAFMVTGKSGLFVGLLSGGLALFYLLFTRKKTRT